MAPGKSCIWNKSEQDFAGLFRRNQSPKPAQWTIRDSLLGLGKRMLRVVTDDQSSAAYSPTRPYPGPSLVIKATKLDICV